MADQNLVQITLRGKDELTGVLKQVQALLSQLGKQQQDSSQRMRQAVNQQTQAWRQFGQVIGGLGIATGIAGITAATVALGKSVVNVGVQIEGMRASLVATSGSVQQGARTFQFLVDTSNRLGIDVLSTSNSFKSLQAATRGTSVEGQATQEIFTALAGAIKVTGGSSEQLNQALIAVQQIISKGTVSSEELRGQLGEALPGAFQVAARAMGVTTAELGKILEQGKLLSTDFILPFVRQLKSEFGPGVEAATGTAGSAFARLGNEIVLAKNEIANSGLLSILKDMATAGANLLKARREMREQQEESMGGAPPAVPAELQGTAIGARAKEIERVRGILTTRRGLIENILYPSREDAQQQLTTLLEDQRTAIKAHQEQLLAEADVPGPFGTMAANAEKLKATEKAVMELFASGRKAIAGIDADIAQNLVDPIQGAEDKLKAWQQTTAEVRKALSTMAQPLRAEFGPLLAEQIKQSNALMASLEAGANVEKERQADMQRTKDIGREVIQDIEERGRKEQDAVRTLQDTARAYQMTAGERERYSAAQLAAQFPANAEIQALAKQAIALSETAEAYEDARERVQEFARAGDLLGLEVAPAVEKARKEQETYNQVLDDTLKLLQTPRAERTSERVRQMAPGGVQTAQQELMNAAILAQERANAQAKEMEDLARDVARGIEGTFLNMWETVFSGGVKSMRDFALLSLQGMQRLLGQVSGQLLNQLLGRAVSGAGGGGGAGGLSGILTSVLGNLATSLFGGSATLAVNPSNVPTNWSVVPAANGGIFAGLSSLRDAGFRQRGLFRGMQPMAFANGAPVVNRPTLALVGEGRFNEAVVPLPDGRSIPVTLGPGMQAAMNQRQAQNITIQQERMPETRGPQIVELHQTMIDPNTMKTTRTEVTQWVLEDIATDGPMRRTISQYAR